ncbi:MAG: GNAT family N-acetyltransferase [Anaerolineales bacterium]|nr:GNAT family N-acetyltransferase [Anaerolineales bacterium]
MQSNITYREISEKDIPVLFEIRTQTHENRLTLEELEALDISAESLKYRLQGTFKGWLAEVDRQAVGFAIGDCATGELWVIAVLPDFIGLGIGSRLLTMVEDWLFSQGFSRLWLTTDIDRSLRAYDFYRHQGWLDDRIEDGLRYMFKRKA